MISFSLMIASKIRNLPFLSCIDLLTSISKIIAYKSHDAFTVICAVAIKNLTSPF